MARGSPQSPGEGGGTDLPLEVERREQGRRETSKKEGGKEGRKRGYREHK